MVGVNANVRKSSAIEGTIYGSALGSVRDQLQHNGKSLDQKKKELKLSLSFSCPAKM